MKYFMEESISELQAELYEVASCTFFMSLVYRVLPRYFTWVRKRRWKRYSDFKKLLSYDRQN